MFVTFVKWQMHLLQGPLPTHRGTPWKLIALQDEVCYQVTTRYRNRPQQIQLLMQTFP